MAGPSSTLVFRQLTSLLCLSAAVAFVPFDANASCGTFGIVKGDIKIQSGSTKKTEAASTGSKICSGDTVISGKDSRAKILINDGAPSGKNELNISPDTRLVLENYEFSPSENKKKVMLNILSGKVRATTTPNFYSDKSKSGQANTFEVRTKSAVAGVRGTDFMTSFEPKSGKSELVTFSGKVMFGQPGPNGTMTNAVAVTPGMTSAIQPGAPAPSAPKAVPPSEMKKMDSESKAETGGAGSSASTSTSGKKGDGKSDSDKSGSDANGDSKSDSKSETKSDAKSDAKSDSKSDAKSDVKSDAKTDSKGDVKGDRGVASTGGGGSMVDSKDLPSNPASAPLAPSTGGVATVPLIVQPPTVGTIQPVSVPPPPQLPTKSKVNVIIHLPGQ